MSRRSRLHYHLATIGYWASRMQARSPRPEGLPGDSLSFGAAVRYELPSHTTSRQNRHPDLGRNDSSCNCFSLMVTSDRSHKGLSPSITAPCPAHLPFRSSLAAGLRYGYVAGLRLLTVSSASGYLPERTELRSTRNPMRKNRPTGACPLRYADRAYCAGLSQLPPRYTRSEPPEAPRGSASGDVL